MSITHEAYLNIIPGDSPAPIIKVSQYDADFSIVFHLIAKKRGIVPAYPRTVENDEDVTINVPTSATVSVRGTKTDGNGYSANATLSGTATAPIVTVAGHEQMTASAGVNVYEITFYADNATKRLSTANFILFVEPAALDASTITSESLMLELNDLIAAVPNAVAAADRAEAAVQSVEGVTTQVATNTQDISDIKADLSKIEPGLSAEAKAALLACFAKVAWIDEHGQNYYDTLASALDQDPAIRFVMTNNAACGRHLATDDNYYCELQTGNTARCRFGPIKNNRNVISVVDAEKYSTAIYDMQNNELVDFITKSGGIERQGYIMSTDVAPTYVKSVKASGTYFACTFKKEDGTDFTTDEIENAEGTIFVVGMQSDVFAWNGSGSAKWVDNNNIIGVHDPKDIALVSGYSISGGAFIDAAFPSVTAKRATSLSQALVGNFDGKKVSLKNYTLSTGAQINFALWYGYITASNTYDGQQVISQENAFTARQWLSTEVTLPTDLQKSERRIILLAFKIANADRDFTQAELREIPTLIQIS